MPSAKKPLKRCIWRIRPIKTVRNRTVGLSGNEHEQQKNPEETKEHKSIIISEAGMPPCIKNMLSAMAIRFAIA